MRMACCMFVVCVCGSGGAGLYVGGCGLVKGTGCMLRVRVRGRV